MDYTKEVLLDKSVDIHVALPRGMLAALDEEARGRGVRRAHLLREAITEFLRRLEAERTEREMVSYAEQMGEESGEFVGETEPHVAERLLRDTEW